MDDSTAARMPNGQPVRILSLDGGGIRGISSILILKEVMRHVNRGRKQELQPWQVFDLIGGTSTGGIIAIMLGCLKMTLDECHDAYIALAKTIFKPKRYKYDIFGRVSDLISANERYSSATLEKVIQGIIADRIGDPRARLHGIDSPCKVFVTTVDADANELVLLRSYDNPTQVDVLSPDFEIWEAARSTSAATTFFEEYQRGGTAYVDGAFKSNNPIFQVHHESKDLWPDRPPFIMSIGTGTKPSLPLRGSVIKLVGTLAKQITETEESWNRFHRGHGEMTDSDMLFRYTVPDIGQVGLGDHDQIQRVKSSTSRWLRSASAEKYVKTCASKLSDITDGRNVVKNATAPSKMVMTAEEKEFLRALHRAAPDYESQRLSIEKAAPGTCKWFFKHPKFQEWHTSTASLLWVTADPGCGKSVLASTLVDFSHHRPDAEAVVLSFFFKAGETTRQQSYQALCAILHGLLSKNQSLMRKFDITSFLGRDPDSFTSSVEDLWQKLCAAVSCLNKQVICIVDALDECNTSSRDRLCRLLASKFASTSTALDPTNPPPDLPSNLKFLVTSRPWPDIESIFRPISSIRLRGEDEAQHVVHDIGLMIHHRVNELVQASAISPQTGEKLNQRLVLGADTTFLWASLILDQVAVMPSRRMSAIDELLRQTPSNLEELYKTALTVLQSEDASIALLEMLLVAKTPLTADEVNIALGVNAHTVSLESLQSDLEPNPEWTIKKLGGFFIRISHSHVHLVHQTAREFLLTGAGARTASLDIQRANTRLAASCIHFLLLEGLPSRQGGLPQDKAERSASNEAYLAAIPPWCSRFFRYSVENWYLHIEDDVCSPESSIHRYVRELCDTNKSCFTTWWPFFVQKRPHGRLRMGRCEGYDHRTFQTYFIQSHEFYAHFAAYRKASGMVRGLVEAGYCAITDENDGDLDLLTIAALTYNTPLIKWMLKNMGHNPAMLGSALLAAASSGSPDNITLIAATGIDVNGTYRIGRRDHSMSRGTPIRNLLDHAERTYQPSHMIPILCNLGFVIQDEHTIETASRGLGKLLGAFIKCDKRSMEDRLPGLQEAYHAATTGGWLETRTVLSQSFPGKLQDIPGNLAIGLRAVANRLFDAVPVNLSVDQFIREGVRDLAGHALYGACEATQDELLCWLLDTQGYSQSQLDGGLNAYFDQAASDELRSYQTTKLATSLGPDACRARAAGSPDTPRPFQALTITSIFGTSYTQRNAVLDMLMEREAKAHPDKFVRMVATVIPMDEDFAVYLLDRIQILQADSNLCVSHFLTVACFWGSLTLVRKILGTAAGFEARQSGCPLLAATISGNPLVVELLLQQEKGPPGAYTASWEALNLGSRVDKEMLILWSIVGSALPEFTSGQVKLVDLARELGYSDIRYLLEQAESFVSPRNIARFKTGHRYLSR